MLKRTFIISAFPGCGKSHATKFLNNKKYTILDIDSIKFSWLKDENGNNTDKPNPEFPKNYIQCIKENIGKADVIFISSNKEVREALKENKIKFILVSPRLNMKKEWIRRFDERGNSLHFIEFIAKNWDKFINEIKEEEDDYCTVNWLNQNHLYLDSVYLDFVFRTYINDWSMCINE